MDYRSCAEIYPPHGLPVAVRELPVIGNTVSLSVFESVTDSAVYSMRNADGSVSLGVANLYSSLLRRLP